MSFDSQKGFGHRGCAKLHLAASVLKLSTYLPVLSSTLENYFNLLILHKKKKASKHYLG